VWREIIVNGSIRPPGCRISNSTPRWIHRADYPLLHRLGAAQPNLPPPSWLCILFLFYINGFFYFHVVGLASGVAWINSQTVWGAAERGLAITWHGAQWRSWSPAIPNVHGRPIGEGGGVDAG
jgi:hypothetical protein